MGCPEGGVISAVRPQSIGEEVGLEPGDLLVSINGQPLRDLIDYRYHSADESLVFEVERQGKRHRLEIERDYDEDLGLEFTQVVFDGMRLCGNRCPFCFVQQMPKGMRPSLYVRDDDYRYSFLLGNFVTLTNLSCEDWQRIEAQRLSPLYVSIHATDPDIRRRLLGNLDAPDILVQLNRLRDMGIASYKIAAALVGVIAQRLIRTICPHCQTQYYPPAEFLEMLHYKGDQRRQFSRGEGCRHCYDTGCKGRLGIYEVLTTTPELRQIIGENPDLRAIHECHRRQGGTSLLEEGIRRAEEGKTSLDEVMQVVFFE